MGTFFENFGWMGFNVLLACLGVMFGLSFLKVRQKFFKLCLFTLWILFLPNTIYLLTDLQHLPKQVFEQSEILTRLMIFTQYIALFVFGVFTYVYGLYPIEKLFHLAGKKDHQLKVILLIVFNFAIAFGVGLGRIERTHSWYVFTQPLRVVDDVASLITNSNSLLFVVLFGLLANILYFSFRKVVDNTLKMRSR